MNKKIISRAFIHAILALTYIFCVALFMKYGAKNIPGPDPNLIAPVVFLLLFVLSAAVMGVLIFGKPVLMYLDNQKKDAIKLLLYTIGWLAAIFFVLILIILTVHNL